jgi:hypothetical protein
VRRMGGRFGDCWPLCPLSVSDWRTGDSELRAEDMRGVLVSEDRFEFVFGGNGNSGPLAFFLRGKRKKVVVVDTV